MKSTGIEWIGDIPSDWVIKKIKYLSTLKGRIGWQGLTSDEYTDEGAYLITGTDFANGGINWNTCVYVSMERWEQAKDIQVENGDLLITKDGTIGKVAIVDGLNDSASLNSGVLRISTFTGFEKKFLYWVLQSDVFWIWFTYKNAGNSTIIHLYQDDFAEFNYPIPPQDEQKTIAAFLDTKCDKIDSIIAELEQQIEILKQYKISLITETITKGLNKNVPMKDSGTDWIGKIPDDWEIKKLKFIMELKAGDSLTNDLLSDDDTLYPVFGGGKQMGYYEKSNVRYNNILIGRVGANCGCITKIPGKAWATDNALVVNSQADLDYLYYILLASDLNNLRDTNAQPLITASKVVNINVPFCSDVHMQKTIVSFLDKKCEEIMSIIEEKQLSIDTMKAYKKSLIYEYVTGKKRV
jgi:restriction endonuclease S subunit